MKNIKKEQEDIDQIRKDMPIVDRTAENFTSIDGLTDEENRELNGVLNPSETIDMSTRQETLKIQSKYFEKLINKTIDEIDLNKGNIQKRIVLEDRVIGLQKAKDLTDQQIEKENVREQQEEDITRLQKFKEWAKENMAGLPALVISIAGTITTIIVGSRKQF